MIKATDKLLVKEYLKEKGLESIIVPTIKVFDTLDQIKYESLPDKFVMKTNSDSGGVCNKLTKDSYIKGMAKINKCLINDFSKYVVEWNYKDINKKIFIESLIETSNQKPPIDYKVFCFNGEPKFLYIATDRPKSTKFDFYDINWNRIHVKNHYPNSLINHEKPKNFDKTIEICRVLSKEFPHVRVDLYNEDDKIYFGELTFFHFSGLQPFNPRIWDYKFGEYFTFDFKD